MGLTFERRTVSNKNFVPYVVGKVKASDFILDNFKYTHNKSLIIMKGRISKNLEKILNDSAREDMHALPTKGGEITTLDGKKYTITNSWFVYKEITEKEPSYNNYK
jgi:hypothetical protein